MFERLRVAFEQTPVTSSTLLVLRLLPTASRPLTIALLGSVVLGGAVSISLILATGAAIGSIPGALEGGFDSGPGRRLVRALTAVAVLYLVQQTIVPFRDVVADTLGRRMNARLEARVMEATLGPPGIAHLEDPATLNLVAMAQGVGAGQFKPEGAVVGLAGNLAMRLQVLTSAALIFWFNWWLPLALVGGGLVARTAVIRGGRRRIQVIAGQAHALRRSSYFRDLALTPFAAKETRVFGLSDWVLDRFRFFWLDAMSRLWRERGETWWRTAVAFAPVAAAILTGLLLAGSAAYDREIGLGGLAVLIQAILGAGQVYITDNDLLLEYGAASIPPALALEEVVTPLQPPGALDAAGLPARELRFESVGFTYPGREAPVFDGLDLTIPAGRSLAVVGPNGAGKTTLVKLLARLYDPSAGRITADGLDLRDLDPERWQQRIAAIFQDFVRYELSAADNVGFGAVDLARLEQAAERAGALDLVRSLPHGWDTVLSREYANGAEVSGGEWQRIALARALYAVEAGAGVLVLDEPTANLDVRAEAELFDRFLDLTQGLTTILVSHRFSTVRRADRIVVLEGGRVTEDGTHDELMAAGGRYAEMFSLQAARFVEVQPHG